MGQPCYQINKYMFLPKLWIFIFLSCLIVKDRFQYNKLITHKHASAVMPKKMRTIKNLTTKKTKGLKYNTTLELEDRNEKLRKVVLTPIKQIQYCTNNIT